MIELDVAGPAPAPRTSTDEELAAREAEWRAPEPAMKGGYQSALCRAT